MGPEWLTQAGLMSATSLKEPSQVKHVVNIYMFFYCFSLMNPAFLEKQPNMIYYFCHDWMLGVFLNGRMVSFHILHHHRLEFGG